jgi:hypothetical protein
MLYRTWPTSKAVSRDRRPNWGPDMVATPLKYGHVFQRNIAILNTMALVKPKTSLGGDAT